MGRTAVLRFRQHDRPGRRAGGDHQQPAPSETAVPGAILPAMAGRRPGYRQVVCPAGWQRPAGYVENGQITAAASGLRPAQPEPGAGLDRGLRAGQSGKLSFCGWRRLLLSRGSGHRAEWHQSPGCCTTVRNAFALAALR